MPQHIHKIGLSILGALALLPVLAAPAACAEQSSLYRCTNAAGQIEFRQFPCHGRDNSLRLELDDASSGWTPPDPAEVFKDKPKPRASDSGTSAGRTEDPTDRRREEKCWSKAQHLERIKRKLRAGYGVGEGERLRVKRREYEDYLKRFCD